MKTKLLITTAFIFLVFAVFVSVATASTIFTDNFESYELGSLNNQGGWVADISREVVRNSC